MFLWERGNLLCEGKELMLAVSVMVEHWEGKYYSG